MASSNKSLSFKVTRKHPELISPAKPTPYEFKYLSDIDNHVGFRCHIPMINFYEKNPSMDGKHPVKVIRDAISKALVFYYPFAGRLREYAGGKLVVECTGEGVMFVEADADVMLHHFGKPQLYPPFPNVDELLPQPCTPGITNCPLFLFQVTRLKCGGFILAYSINHAMCDGAGVTQFMFAVAEVARGGAAPSIPPVWQRHLLRSRRPPRRKYDVISDTSGGTGTGTPVPQERMVHHSFFLSTTDISALLRSMPPHLQRCSKFDVVTACAWRCRTVAISPKPDENVIFVCVVDIRNRIAPPLPMGYYGNGVVFSAAVTSAEKLTKNPLHHAVDMVRAAKNNATDEYVRAFVDAEVLRDRASLMEGRIYAVSDLTSKPLCMDQVDFGWGKAVYGGVAKGVADWILEPLSWYIPIKDDKGDEGIILPVYLPLKAMEVFAKQLQMMITTASNFNISAL